MARMNSARPNRKVVVGGISALTVGQALSTIVVYIAQAATGQALPDPVHTAIDTLLVVVAYFVASYLTPPGDNEAVVPDTPPQP